MAIAIGLADQVTLSLIGPFFLVVNTLLGRFVLKENSLTPFIIISCMLLIAGSVLGILFANYDS